MSCEKCPHCIRKLNKKERKKPVPKVKEPYDPLSNRTCKICNEEKNIKEFSIVKNANGFENYRRICKKCVINRKKEYMKEYHLKNYVSKKKTDETSNAPQEVNI